MGETTTGNVLDTSASKDSEQDGKKTFASTQGLNDASLKVLR
jgi:hypothetical protein